MKVSVKDDWRIADIGFDVIVVVNTRTDERMLVDDIDLHSLVDAVEHFFTEVDDDDAELWISGDDR